MNTIIKTLLGVSILISAPAAFGMLVYDVQNPYEWMTEGETHTVVHDLTDDGVPDEYRVVGAVLKLGFSDGYYSHDEAWDVAKLSGDGLYAVWEVDGTHYWGFDIRWAWVGGAGIDSLNTDGKLEVSITALYTPDYYYHSNYNDFWWKTSKLIAKVEKVDVPEPGTLGLMVMGLMGLGIARRMKTRG